MSEQTSPIRVDVQIDVELAREKEELLHTRLRAAVRAAAAEADRAIAGEVTLVITDDEQMQALNRTYRGQDSTTDVLSFVDRDENDGGDLVTPADMPAYLGDIVISYPQAKRQAAERAHSEEGELCLLAIHGMLHILGHDHAEPDEKDRMWAVQRAALRRLGHGDVTPTDD